MLTYFFIAGVETVLIFTMFGFMKKDKDREDKERKKKDKKDRKDGKKGKERVTLTLDELRRLDEARRSLIGKGRKKDKEKLPSGITGDYMDQFRAGLERDEFDQPDHDISSATSFQQLRERYEAMASASSLQSDSSSDGVSHRSNLPPRPPKRGILKGKQCVEYQGVQGNIDDECSLMQNTMQNELIMYENLKIEGRLDENGKPHSFNFVTSPGRRVSNGSASISPCSPAQQLSPQHMPIDNHKPYVINNYSTPSSEPVSPSSPLPIGEGLGLHNTKAFTADLRLPALVPAQPPAPRTLTIVRSPAGDFGFSLRRAQVIERGPGNSEARRTIVFAEPGAIGHSNVTGLLPGDRLLQVNGITVENKTRDEIIDLIKASPESVTLVVSMIILVYVVK